MPRITLNISEACEALGVAWGTWHAHIEPRIKVIRVGRCKLVAVAELEAWAAEHGERLEDVVR